MELVLTGSGPLVRQVYEALLRRMESGMLPGGTRLPGSRSLARELGISRGTVVSAYERLEAEGYCRTHPRSGTRVVDIFPGGSGAQKDEPARGRTPHPIRWRADGEGHFWDLRSGLPNPADFPLEVWMRLTRRELGRSLAEAFDYPHPEGLPRLRTAIAAHLRLRRGLTCSPDQVLITEGAQQAFSLITRVLLPAGVPVAVEDPGYRGFGQVARASGLELLPVPVDEEGLVVGALPAGTVSAAYVTPAHQFPSGVLMSAARRRALLNWAAEHQAWIVEDDYDSAYRFDAPPLPPLKQLDARGRVLLVGSFSKTIFPGLRLGYVVADVEHLTALAMLKNLEDAGSFGLHQAVLAAFLEEGHYDRHLRRSRRRQSIRRRALIDALRARFGGHVLLLGAESGLHLVADLGLSEAQEREAVRLARERGLGLHAQRSFSLGKSLHRGLLLSYARLEAEDAPTAVKLLADVVDAVRQRSGRSPLPPAESRA